MDVCMLVLVPRTWTCCLFATAWERWIMLHAYGCIFGCSWWLFWLLKMNMLDCLEVWRCMTVLKCKKTHEVLIQSLNLNVTYHAVMIHAFGFLILIFEVHACWVFFEWICICQKSEICMSFTLFWNCMKFFLDVHVDWCCNAYCSCCLV